MSDTIRDELAAILGRGSEADLVLEWLGNLDPDADRDLIVWHLRNDRQRIDELEGAIADALHVLSCVESLDLTPATSRLVGVLPGLTADDIRQRYAHLIEPAVCEAPTPSSESGACTRPTGHEGACA